MLRTALGCRGAEEAGWENAIPESLGEHFVNAEIDCLGALTAFAACSPLGRVVNGGYSGGLDMVSNLNLFSCCSTTTTRHAVAAPATPLRWSRALLPVGYWIGASMSTSVLLAPEQVVDTYPRIKEEVSVEVLGLEPGLPNGGDEMHEPNYVSLVVILKPLRPH
jgi:hypothetical protein